jgi:simple sugar transport system permease protein
MDVVYDIPVLGIVVQLVAYLAQVLPLISPTILVLATPIALGALCGFMNERSGVVNIGIEGMMLTSAFVGWYVASLVNQGMPGGEGGLLGITFPLLVGLLGAMLAGMLVSALHAWLSISVRADQIISGTIINIAALGLTGYLNILISQQAPPTAGSFDRWAPPSVITDIPLIGWILKMFLQQGPIAMSVIVLVIILQVLLYRSRWGLRTRAVGEHPRAAETVGIDVIRLRYRNVILGGIFAGLAGGFLTLEATNGFQSGMTVGRGFIALAALIFGRWTPVGAFLAALLFALSGAIGTAVRIAPPTGDLAGLGDLLVPIPGQVFTALPYIVTIIVLAGVVGRSVPPAADGLPYERESKAA